MHLSVLIRNLNESKSLQVTLQSLRRQLTDLKYEVIVIDNESTDDSVIVAEGWGCKVTSLKREEFTYGRALNFGIDQCKGEIILILSAHVVLLSEFFLNNIPKYFEDNKVAGLRFVQASLTDDVASSFREKPKILSYTNDEDFAMLNWNHLIVNHCAAIKRSVWQQQPFDETIFASEDKIWSIEILKSGYSILYNIPNYYIYTKPFERPAKIKRAIIEGAAKEKITGYVHPPYIRAMTHRLFASLKSVYTTLLIDHKVYKGIKKYRS